MHSASEYSDHQTLTVCCAQILQEPAGGINPPPTITVHPCASFCMSSSRSTATCISKAAMANPWGPVPARGIWGVHNCWEIASNLNSLKYSFRSSLVPSEYLSHGLIQHCPSDSHLVATVRSIPQWCPAASLSLSHQHAATYLPTLAEWNSFMEKHFFQVQSCHTQRMHVAEICTIHKLNGKFQGQFFIILFILCFGCKVSASWIGNSDHSLCEGVNRNTSDLHAWRSQPLISPC